MSGSPVHEYQRRSRAERSIQTASSAALCLVAAGLVIQPGRDDPELVRGVGALLALLALFAAVRSLRWGTIAVYPDLVRIRGFLQTATLPRSDIVGFTVEDGLNENEQPATALAVKTRAGDTKVFADFRSDEHEGGFSAQALADQLNLWIAA